MSVGAVAATCELVAEEQDKDAECERQGPTDTDTDGTDPTVRSLASDSDRADCDWASLSAKGGNTHWRIQC